MKVVYLVLRSYEGKTETDMFFLPMFNDLERAKFYSDGGKYEIRELRMEDGRVFFPGRDK